MRLIELQIDRVVGPTHHFGGLGVGNVASHQNAGRTSNPAAAARQGLDKMRLVAELTGAQFILPPQPRPALGFLRELGFTGTDGDVLRQAFDEAPHLLSAACSCSAMWTANAATVSPAIDSVSSAESEGNPQDSLSVTSHSLATQLTVANLVASVHRAIEPQQTAQELKAVLTPTCFVHASLPGGTALRDEGAANHMRLGTERVQQGLHLFVDGDATPAPRINWPRQTRAAQQAIARLHRLSPQDTFFLHQHPDAIDAGAFHNDVVAMSHHGLLIHHEFAFVDADETLQNIERRYESICASPVTRIVVNQDELSLEDAVTTYLFNSQIVSSRENRQASSPPILLCPRQVELHPQAKQLVEKWCDQGHFHSLHYVDLDQSMAGGGGPACLRLRVPIPESLASSVPNRAQWSLELDERLREVINQNYSTEVTLRDLARMEFHQHASETQQAIVRCFQ